MCVVRTLREYISRSESRRSSSQPYLILGTQKPFRCVSRDTLARWTRRIMKDAGIDVELFTAHSTRGATTSKMVSLHVPINMVMRKASWTQESTFRRFYLRPVVPDEDIAHHVLANFLNNT